MSTIATLTSSETGADSLTDINNNFANLNTDKVETSPYIHLSKSATQDIGGANGTIVYISWNVQDSIDTDTFTHSTSTNNSRITIDVTGRYQIYATVSATTTGSNRTTWGAYGRVNGSTDKIKGRGYGYTRGAAYGATSMQWVTELDLTANDYIEIATIVDDADATVVSNTIDAECEVIIRKI